ncbi:MAG: hypothetical protein OEX07_02350 [Gammaproteobacteria bacterium]|nr:hypothetical protein [Gammaproteobacteria bacterium]
MKFIESNSKFFKLSPLSMAFATVLGLSHINLAMAEPVPEGFFLMPDGKLMADNPATAVAPEGYHLRPNGILLKIDFEDDKDILSLQPAPSNAGDTPDGFHRMSDGTLMANNPKSTPAPPGFHMMADGTLMSNSGGGSHHGAGMWMVDYKFTHMSMKDLRDTNDKLTAQVATDPLGKYKYTMSPSDMSMNMHMGMLMYGFTNQIMGMTMLHYMSNNMNMYSYDGTVSTMKSSGIGDTPVSLKLKGPHHLNFTIGLSLPTGSIDVRGPMQHDATNFQNDIKYPYGMQLGSGSYELIQGIDYSNSAGKISWGANYQLNARLNVNKHDYKLGNTFKLESWTQWDAISLLDLKAFVQLHNQGQITGADKEIEPAHITMSPSYDAENYGGNKIYVGGSAKIKIPGDKYSVTTDFSIPVYQNLWGPQMATSWVASVNLGAMW